MTDKHINQLSEYDILLEDVYKLFGFANTFPPLLWVKTEIQKYQKIQQSLSNKLQLCESTYNSLQENMNAI